jgi:hypothetical protein
MDAELAVGEQRPWKLKVFTGRNAKRRTVEAERHGDASPMQSSGTQTLSSLRFRLITQP